MRSCASWRRSRSRLSFYAAPVLSTNRCLQEISSEHALTLRSSERCSLRHGRDGAAGNAQPGRVCEHRSVAGFSGTSGADTRADEGGIASQQQRWAVTATPASSDASGVCPKTGPGRSEPDSCCTGDREIDAGEPGGSEPQRRLSAGPRIVVRGRRCGAKCARQCGAVCARRGAAVVALTRSMVQRRVRRKPNAGAIGARCTNANGPRCRSNAARLERCGVKPRCVEPGCRAAAPCPRDFP